MDCRAEGLSEMLREEGLTVARRGGMSPQGPSEGLAPCTLPGQTSLWWAPSGTQIAVHKEWLEILGPLTLLACSNVTSNIRE